MSLPQRQNDVAPAHAQAAQQPAQEAVQQATAGAAINLGANPLFDAATQQKARSANAYLRTRVMSASPEELRLLLLEGAVRFAGQGREGIVSKNYEQSFTGLSGARDIVIELMTTIREDVNPDLASNVKALYLFIYQQLIEGGHERDIVKIDKAIELLDYEVETWKLLMQQLHKERASTLAHATPSIDPITAASSGIGSAPASRAPLAVQG